MMRHKSIGLIASVCCILVAGCISARDPVSLQVVPVASMPGALQYRGRSSQFDWEWVQLAVLLRNETKTTMHLPADYSPLWDDMISFEIRTPSNAEPIAVEPRRVSRKSLPVSFVIGAEQSCLIPITLTTNSWTKLELARGCHAYEIRACAVMHEQVVYSDWVKIVADGVLVTSGNKEPYVWSHCEKRGAEGSHLDNRQMKSAESDVDANGVGVQGESEGR